MNIRAWSVAALFLVVLATATALTRCNAPGAPPPVGGAARSETNQAAPAPAGGTAAQLTPGNGMNAVQVAAVVRPAVVNVTTKAIALDELRQPREVPAGVGT